MMYLDSLNINTERFLSLLQGNDLIAKTAKAENSFKLFIESQEADLRIKDLLCTLIVGDIGKNPEVLLSFSEFQSSKFAKSLAINDLNHLQSIYNYLRAWIGPESVKLSEQGSIRLKKYKRYITNFHDDPGVISALRSKEVRLAGHPHESIMLLERMVYLRYFGISLTITSYLLANTGGDIKIPFPDIFAVPLEDSFDEGKAKVTYFSLEMRS